MKNITEINQHIKANGLSFEVVKNASKKYEVTDTATGSVTTFTKVSQVVDFITREKSRKTNPRNVVRLRDSQGSDAFKVDTSKLVLVQTEIRSPRPSKIVDPVASAQLKKTVGDAYDAITDQLRDEDGKVYPELKRVTTIRDSFKSFLEKVAVPISMNGARVISVHHIDKVKTKIAETNDELDKVASAIQAKLPEWAQIAKDKGNYVEGKFPTEEYFTGYGVHSRFLTFHDSHDIESDISEIQEATLTKMNEAVSGALEAINGFISGDKRSFRENSINNMVEIATNLKEAGFIDSEAFVNLAEKVVEFANEFDADAVRNSVEIVKKGVVIPEEFDADGNKKRGRKAKAVTAEDIQKEKEGLEKAIDPLQGLAAELQGLV